MKYDIFISYRRKDSSGRSNVPTARQFKLAFEAPPYNYKVFFDYSECTDNYFSDTILPAIRTCDFFVLVLTKDCLARCVNEGDWVRREIEEAIAYNKKIIPITPDRECETFPSDLPDSLRKTLYGLQITTVYTDHMFESSIDFLVKHRFHLNKALTASETERNAKEAEERERREKERIAKEARLKAVLELEEQERLDRERAEAERKAKEAEERERQEKERLAKEVARLKAELELEEQERLDRERAEAERNAKEAEERERLEKERLAKEARLKAGLERQEQERLARERAETERKAKEEAERERLEREQKTKQTNGHEYVDLGLPSGTLWATCNVGANKPEDYGDYFSWDEGKTAAAKWGNGWAMPTKEQWEELKENTKSSWTTRNGVNGRLFTANNGNSLFLPAAGYHWVDYYGDYGVDDYYNVDSWGIYWSSSLYKDDPSNVWSFYFLSGRYYVIYDDCRIYDGQSVRPVRSARQN